MASFNEQTPQQQAAAAAALLRERGVPATAENMNRAYMALMQGQSDMTGDNAPVMERAIQRTMAPRRAAPASATAPKPAPVARGGSSEDDRPDGNPPRPVQQAQPQTRGAQVAAAAELPPTQRSAAMPGGRRAGTINGAQRIEGFDSDEPQDPNQTLRDLPVGTQPRQADETGVDQMGLAIALGLPLLMALGGAGVGGAAARGATAGRGGATASRAEPAAEYVGRMPMVPNGRIIDVPQTAITGPAQRGMLPGPGAPPPAIGGPGPGAPRLPGGGGDAQQVGGPTVNQPSLPRPDGDLRRRMIDRNMERSNRNAARTRDERAAGNNTRGRRERIEPVPAGEATPRPPQQAIPLGRPRYRVPARSAE